RAAHARLVQRLRDQADDVRRLVAGLDEEALAKRTVADKWALKELVAHVLKVQRVFSERLETMLTQDNPTMVSYSADNDPGFEKIAARRGRDPGPVPRGARAPRRPARRPLTAGVAPRRDASRLPALRRPLPDGLPGASRGAPHLPDAAAPHAFRKDSARGLGVLAGGHGHVAVVVDRREQSPHHAATAAGQPDLAVRVLVDPHPREDVLDEDGLSWTE